MAQNAFDMLDRMIEAGSNFLGHSQNFDFTCAALFEDLGLPLDCFAPVARIEDKFVLKREKRFIEVF
jgi:hypothetical protein